MCTSQQKWKLHDRTGRLEIAPTPLMTMSNLHDRTGRLEICATS